MYFRYSLKGSRMTESFVLQPDRILGAMFQKGGTLEALQKTHEQVACTKYATTREVEKLPAYQAL